MRSLTGLFFGGPQRKSPPEGGEILHLRREHINQVCLNESPHPKAEKFVAEAVCQISVVVPQCKSPPEDGEIICRHAKLFSERLASMKVPTRRRGNF